MTITERREKNALVIGLEGSLDTLTAPELEAFLDAGLDGVTELTIDMEQLRYLSSAGLRVILAAQKRMSRKGRMRITHVHSEIMKVFRITGFADILTIEESEKETE